jgi:hypothetical protein
VSHLTEGYCWSTPFNVLGVPFLGAVSPAFLPYKKAYWAHQFRYLGVDQQYPEVLRHTSNRLPFPGDSQDISCARCGVSYCETSCGEASNGRAGPCTRLLPRSRKSCYDASRWVLRCSISSRRSCRSSATSASASGNISVSSSVMWCSTVSTSA